MDQPFSPQINEMADAMGVSLYQRFSMAEAALFLRCPVDDVEKLVKKHQIAYIQLVGTQVDFFGHQLVEYLADQVVERKSPLTSMPEGDGERILRAVEVQQMTGLSRTTLWRLEQKGDFPQRLPLSLGRVGWLKSDILNWVSNR